MMRERLTRLALLGAVTLCACGENSEAERSSSGPANVTDAAAQGQQTGAAGGSIAGAVSMGDPVQKIDALTTSITTLRPVTPQALGELLGVTLSKQDELGTPHPSYVGRIEDPIFSDLELRRPSEDQIALTTLLILTVRPEVFIDSWSFGPRFLGKTATPSSPDARELTRTYFLEDSSGYELRYTFTRFDDRLIHVVIAHD